MAFHKKGNVNFVGYLCKTLLYNIGNGLKNLGTTDLEGRPRRNSTWGIVCLIRRNVMIKLLEIVFVFIDMKLEQLSPPNAPPMSA